MPLLFAGEFHPLILQGIKTMTTRKDRHEVGEIFQLWSPGRRRHVTYHIVRVQRMTLNTVAQKHFKEEGFESPLEFIGWWSSHYSGGWTPGMKVWLHTFEEAGP